MAETDEAVAYNHAPRWVGLHVDFLDFCNFRLLLLLQDDTAKLEVYARQICSTHYLMDRDVLFVPLRKEFAWQEQRSLGLGMCTPGDGAPAGIQCGGGLQVLMRCSGEPRNETIELKLIREQSSSWSFSVAEVAFKVVFAVGHFILYRKTNVDEKQNLADRLGDAASDLLKNAY